LKFLDNDKRAAAQREKNPIVRPSGHCVTTPQFAGIIESIKSPYIHLICGHITNADEVIFYSLWRPSQDKYYCERCGKWVKREPKKVVADLPDKPMF
jgi:hypothetical protein